MATIAGLGAVTEVYSRVAGGIQGCGQAAMAVLLHWSAGEPLSPGQVTNYIKQGVSGGQTVDPQGATTIGNLQWLAGQYNVGTTQYPGSQWQSVLNQYAGQRPVVVGVSNASAFGGTDANVQGHYITVLGTTANGNYVVSDPNTVASESGQTVEYTPQQMAAARPFGLLVPTQASGTAAGAAPAATLSSTSAGSCKHSVSLFPGNTTCLDAPLDLLIRGGLVVAGLAFVLLAIVIFGLGDKETPGPRELAKTSLGVFLP